MIKRLIIQAYFCFSCFLGCSQSAEWDVLASLPKELEENSGIVFYPPNKVVYINDSGNKPEILATDTLGNLTQKFCVPGLTNVDWEELAKDEKGNIYIGDFGNNLNNRRDLSIYKLPSEQALNGEDHISISEIKFRYEDQIGFPPNKRAKNFDTEAMIHLGDSIYLFTKNRTKPFDGYTYCYRIPDVAGDYIAEKVDSFSTGSGPKEAFWISGAAYRDNPKTLLLLGYNKLWMFYYYPENKFFSGRHNVIYFDSFSQKEAITFKEGNQVLLTDEKNSKNDGNLYTLELPEIYRNVESVDTLNDSKIILDNRKIENVLKFKLLTKSNVNLKWEAFNKKGQRLYWGELNEWGPGGHQITLDVSDWKKGKYELHILTNNTPHIFKIKKKNPKG